MTDIKEVIEELRRDFDAEIKELGNQEFLTEYERFIDVPLASIRALLDHIAELEGRNATLESFAQHIDELFSQMKKGSQSAQLNPLAFGGRRVAKQLEELGDRISSRAREALASTPANDGGG